MKNLLILLTLSITAASVAGTKTLEFDEDLEKKCYVETKQLGCADLSDSSTNRCVEKKKSKLSDECRAMHEVKVKI